MIKTPRLTLRRFTSDDAKAMFENWATDPLTVKYLSWELHPSAEFTKTLLEGWIENYAKADNYNWLIEFDKTPIGNINVHNISDKKGSCEIGYCMGSQWWNNGIMTEALCAVIDFLFTEVGMHRIAAVHDEENGASGRVMQKAGMFYEGKMRENCLRKDGTYSGMCIYGILKSDRETTRERKVKEWK